MWQGIGKSLARFRRLRMELLETRSLCAIDLVSTLDMRFSTPPAILGASAANVSDDGRYVVFQSSSSELTPGDRNGATDIFYKDRLTGLLQLVSASASGVIGNQASYDASISDDGRFVCFTSRATNLVTGDTNNLEDAFVKDMHSGYITRVSTSSTGEQITGNVYAGGRNAKISGNGAYVVFMSSSAVLNANDTNGETDIYVKNLITGELVFVSSDSSGNSVDGGGVSPSISDDGRRITFESVSPDLVVGDTNQVSDVFVRDLNNNTIIRASLDSSQGEIATTSYSSTISGNGRYVVFLAEDTNLVTGDTNLTVDGFRKDLDTGAVVRFTLDAQGDATFQSPYLGSSPISDDGNYVTFSATSKLAPLGYENTFHSYRKNLVTGVVDQVDAITAILPNAADTKASSISGDGKIVAFDNIYSFPASSAARQVFAWENLAPRLVDDLLVTQPNTPILIAPLFNDVDAEHDPLIITSVTAPTLGTTQLINGMVVLYTPPLYFYGAETFTYTAHDDRGNVVEGNISVRVNRNPLPQTDVVITAKNSGLLIAPLYNDRDQDGEDQLSLTNLFPVTGGTAQILPGNLVQFTPAANFVGLATIPYRVSDGVGGDAVGLISINVFDKVRMDGDRLWVQGTSGPDTMIIRPGEGVYSNRIEVEVNNEGYGYFMPASIVMEGLAGDDQLRVESRVVNGTMRFVGIPVALRGNEGNDTLSTAALRSLGTLIGGDGNDVLTGSDSRDILIGGNGSDTLSGGGEEDILVGGALALEAIQTPLDLIMMEWARADASFDVRKQHLTGVLSNGFNAAWYLPTKFYLRSNTISKDANRDTLLGGSGRDLIYASYSANPLLGDLLRDASLDDKVTI